ncbi:RCC1/BLIP-II [Aspergillus sclerotiicarbonarius CBS 121057]|uniref:RCC1/BLIP-II n=1 Tax=Aspergillus sclerotiicarbonarius (strain CBS 121057 / IBT 28362) TaxID=1448318 RepID=A0A319EQT5_ASPSB|nr:RCC1/BLIP-II [Aspergillus sclerotiicarbonarius CBS 121057]
MEPSPKMQIFACGENSAGWLGEPPCCVRRYVNEPHECQHNNGGKDSFYCPLWVLKPTEFFRGLYKIRVIYYENDAGFFDVDGELKHRGADPLKQRSLAEATRSWNINSLTGAARLADGFVFLTEDGTLLTVRDTDGVQSFSRNPIQHIATRRVDLHNPKLVSGAVAIVLKQDPRTILSFDSWKPVCSFLEASAPDQGPIHTATLSSPIVKLTSKFAALTESGEVFMWGDELPEQPPTPSDYDEDEWMDALLEFSFCHKPIEKWPSWEPKRLDYEPQRQPLPPIKTLSTGGVNNAAVSRSGQLFLWGYKSNKWPEIEDVNDHKCAEFKEALIPNPSTPLQIKSAAAGRKHVIVLATDGSLWSAGEAVNGQLGIGLRQFGLCTEGNVIDVLENEKDEEFAVSWERMDTEALVGLECEEVFADGEHTLILTSSRT